jgi:hypothetical protein
MSLMEAIVDPLTKGSRLDADHPENGVLIPCRITNNARLVEIVCLDEQLALLPRDLGDQKRGAIAADVDFLAVVKQTVASPAV